MNKEKIIDAVDDALVIAYLAHLTDGRDFGSVNWADLECVELVGTADGWVAYVEEAAPDCEQLQLHVGRTLANRGIENVAVVTRW